MSSPERIIFTDKYIRSLDKNVAKIHLTDTGLNCGFGDYYTLCGYNLTDLENEIDYNYMNTVDKSKITCSECISRARFIMDEWYRRMKSFRYLPNRPRG